MPVDVSVIIPTFRRPAQLVEAIQSALAQERVGVEVIVVDDSPEGSARAAVEGVKDERVRYRQNTPPSGGLPGLVRNQGWPLATGRYVHFLDDDDKVAAGAYRAAVDALDAHPEIGVAFGRVEPFGDNPEVLAHQRAYFEAATHRARVAQRLGSRRWFAASMLFQPTMLVNSACIIRRECIGRVNGYDPTIPVVEDVEFYVRAIRACGFIFLDRVILHYRTGAPSIMHNERDAARTRATYDLMFRKYRATYGELEFAAVKAIGRTLVRWL